MSWCFELKIPCPRSLERRAVHEDQGLTSQNLEDRSPHASHGKLCFEDFYFFFFCVYYLAHFRWSAQAKDVAFCVTDPFAEE